MRCHVHQFKLSKMDTKHQQLCTKDRALMLANLMVMPTTDSSVRTCYGLIGHPQNPSPVGALLMKSLGVKLGMACNCSSQVPWVMSPSLYFSWIFKRTGHESTPALLFPSITSWDPQLQLGLPRENLYSLNADLTQQNVVRHQQKTSLCSSQRALLSGEQPPLSLL